MMFSSLCLDFFYVEEVPKFDSKDQRAMFKKFRPLPPPQSHETAKCGKLFKFCKEVQFILKTISESEFQAAVTYMKPPFDDYKKSVIFPSAGSVVGMFAGHKAALIQTDVGANAAPFLEQAIKDFPNAKFVAGVGVGYSFHRSKHKLGDVMVSKQISSMTNFIVKDGTINNRKRHIDVPKALVALFCRDLTYDNDFELTKEPDPETGKVRTAQVFAGKIVSYAQPVDSQEMHDKLLGAFPRAIGGEMEGGELLKLQKNRSIRDGVILIKGITDFGDGHKGNSWQFTAAMAALAYVETKLYYWQGKLDEFLQVRHSVKNSRACL